MRHATKLIQSKTAIILLGAGVSLLALLETPWHARWEAAMLDGFFQLGGAVEARDDIVILGINSDSMEFHEDEIEAHPKLGLLTDWPWPREVHALVLEKLIDAGARVVAFDILFPSPSLYGEADDTAFRETLDQHRDQVIIGMTFEELERERGRARLIMPAPTVAPEGLREEITALVDYPTERDGAIRRARFQTTEAVGSGIRSEPMAGENPILSFPALTAQKLDAEVVVPPWDARHLIPYAGPSGTFPQYPVFQVLHDRYWDRNFRDGAFFEGKVVLVGSTAGFMHDRHQTPFGSMAGVEIHANTLAMLLDGSSLREIPLPGKVLLTLFAGVVIAGGLLIWRGPYVAKFLLLVATGAAGFLLSLFLFRNAGVVAAFPEPYIALFGTGLAGLATQFTAEQIEKKRLHRTFATFVSPDVAEYLVENPDQYRDAAAGKQRHCVILFSDIRGFTSLTEQAKDPEELVHQLNEYLSAWVRCVFKHQGTLDKFVGDAVMAVWGGIHSRGAREDAIGAVQAALDMRDELKQLNSAWKADGKPEFQIGVGINAGNAVVGNMGSPGQKLEFTVIGDAVNVAARLEGETKTHDRDLLVSEAVRDLVRDHVATEFLAETPIRGRQQTVRIYSLKR